MPPAELAALSSEEIIEKLESGQISLLKSFGADEIRDEMKKVGKVCRSVLRLIFLTSRFHSKSKRYWQRIRLRAASLISFFFPYTINDSNLETNSNGLIIGFNHLALHEILSLIAFALKKFNTRRNNFPTNLPWYESICTKSSKLRSIGIYMMPLITPSTSNLIRRLQQDEEVLRCMEKVKEKLLQHYINKAVEFSKSGDNTFAAPSATRQATIFPSLDAYQNYEKRTNLYPVMGMLKLHIKRYAKEAKVDFVPITVMPQSRQHSRGLDLFKRYALIIGRTISIEEATNIRNFDHEFLKRIAENAPEYLWHPKATT